MKTINVSFEDAETEAIERAKGGQPWREFIKSIAEPRVLELHDNEGINRFSIAFDVSNNLVFTFDISKQIDLKSIVIKVPDRKRGN